MILFPAMKQGLMLRQRAGGSIWVLRIPGVQKWMDSSCSTAHLTIWQFQTSDKRIKHTVFECFSQTERFIFGGDDSTFF
jgi:hypothetical protein